MDIKHHYIRPTPSSLGIISKFRDEKTTFYGIWYSSESEFGFTVKARSLSTDVNVENGWLHMASYQWGAALPRLPRFELPLFFAAALKLKNAEIIPTFSFDRP
jgi:hypothetical protein